MGYNLRDYTVLDYLNILVTPQLVLGLFNLLMAYGSFSYLRSAHENVRKYVGISNCLTIVSIPYKNCFQYSGVPLTGLINDNILSLARDFKCFSRTTFN